MLWRKSNFAPQQSDFAPQQSDFMNPNALRKKIRPAEGAVEALLFIVGVLTVFITISIVLTLGDQALLFFNDPAVTLAEFFGTTQWQPQAGQ